MTKPNDLRQLGESERQEKLRDSQKELFNLRFQLATGRLDNVSRIGVVRKEIARLLTIAKEEAPVETPVRRRRPRRRRG
jgi:large subunit ribosomal protein L29